MLYTAGPAARWPSCVSESWVCLDEVHSPYTHTHKGNAVSLSSPSGLSCASCGVTSLLRFHTPPWNPPPGFTMSSLYPSAPKHTHTHTSRQNAYMCQSSLLHTHCMFLCTVAQSQDPWQGRQIHIQLMFFLWIRLLYIHNKKYLNSRDTFLDVAEDYKSCQRLSVQCMLCAYVFRFHVQVMDSCTDTGFPPQANTAVTETGLWDPLIWPDQVQAQLTRPAVPFSHLKGGRSSGRVEGGGQPGSQCCVTLTDYGVTTWVYFSLWSSC